ncbi:hypothetical protein VTK56DRAFT_9926 [Thermocarpiscus australiensis]
MVPVAPRIAPSRGVEYTPRLLTYPGRKVKSSGSNVLLCSCHAGWSFVQAVARHPFLSMHNLELNPFPIWRLDSARRPLSPRKRVTLDIPGNQGEVSVYPTSRCLQSEPPETPLSRPESQKSGSKKQSVRHLPPFPFLPLNTALRFPPLSTYPPTNPIPRTLYLANQVHLAKKTARIRNPPQRHPLRRRPLRHAPH